MNLGVGDFGLWMNFEPRDLGCYEVGCEPAARGWCGIRPHDQL